VSDDAWTRVIVSVDPADADVASDILWQAGTAAIEEQDADGRTTLLGGFDSEAGARGAAEALGGAGYADVRTEAVTDDGLDGWREFAKVERAGRFVLVPAWLEVPEPEGDEVILLIDPGPTFGSGSHPTTRLCLEAMQDLDLRGKAVLDVGTGSGVLAIAAAKLGATRVVAIDIDPASPEMTTANARRNGVGEVVVASNEPLSEVVASGSTFDVVLANLLAPIIEELAPDLPRSVHPTGSLVVSGVLADRWSRAVEHVQPLRALGVIEAAGWAAVTLERPPEAAT
jgi:ribosomal protein L11 methyltransferase